jgi:dihydroflavonol-4-reductase
VAAGHVLAMEKGRIGQSYALTNKAGNMTNKEILTLIGRIAGVSNVAKNEVSGKTMMRVAHVVEAISKVTGRAPMTTVKNTRYVLQHGYVDSSKAIEELGLPQTPIETAVADAVKWFRNNGYA